MEICIIPGDDFMHISMLLMEQIVELFIMIFMGFAIVKAGGKQGSVKNSFISGDTLCDC